jgi:hypothetical protein
MLVLKAFMMPCTASVCVGISMVRQSSSFGCLLEVELFDVV